MIVTTRRCWTLRHSLPRVTAIRPFPYGSRNHSSAPKPRSVPFLQRRRADVATNAQSQPTPLVNLFSVKGKTIICTGITGGLGKVLCNTLAEAGANIVSIQLPGDPELAPLEKDVRAHGSEFLAFECNVEDSARLRKCFEDIWASGIVPDILLNCAGTNRRGPVETLTDADIELVLDVNLKGSFVAAQEMAKRLLQLKRPGKIINIGSMTAYQPLWHTATYAAAKAGVVQFTKAFSNELASQNIQVNCISPGYFLTPMTTALAETEEYNNFILARTPAGHWGDPSDLRGALLFLASPASNFVSGTSIVVDGGMLGM